MAAHSYYDASQTANPYHDYIQPPLSPVPRSHSPYSDHRIPTQSYRGSGSRFREGDPFDDDNSIPLSGRKSKHDSSATIAPILQHQQEDDFVRDADPRKQRRRRRRQKDGWFSGKITWVVFVLTTVQIVVFIAELIRNGILTSSPIEIHPSFNPMIGPSPYVLINMGARYQPCMHNMPNVQNASLSISWPCPNATSTTGSDVSCSLSDLCGFNGVPNPHPGGSIDDKPAPNQWYRFIIPIFLHAGIIHISFNLLLQLTLGRDIEKLIGSVRFAIVYFASGIWGFVLGGNFAANGIASCGCSGSLFGILAITLLDLLYNWKERKGPVKELLFIGLDICIAFVLGLLPGLDNFSHIGGFLMGLVLGVCILRSPTAISRRTSAEEYYGSSHSRKTRNSAREGAILAFVKNPIGFFKDRRGIWWIWWLVRAAALVGVLIGFILLIKNFYVWRTTCGWCKYLSCLPVTVDGENWCQVGNLDFTNTTTHNKRSLMYLASGTGFNPMDHIM